MYNVYSEKRFRCNIDHIIDYEAINTFHKWQSQSMLLIKFSASIMNKALQITRFRETDLHLTYIFLKLHSCQSADLEETFW